MIWLRGRAVKCFSLLVPRVLVRKPLLEQMKYKQFIIKFVERMEYQHFQGLVAVWLAGCLAGWLPGWLAACVPGWLAAVPAACCSELWARAPELTTFGCVTGGHPEARAGCVIGVHSEPRDRFYVK